VPPPEEEGGSDKDNDEDDIELLTSNFGTQLAPDGGLSGRETGRDALRRKY
jgi:hypothetical protein